MKDNFIHVAFVIDESGSMYDSASDVIGGFKQVIDEQKANKEGEVAVSLFTFNNKVTQVYMGKNINEVENIEGSYRPHGSTAMNDGIGTAIDTIGKWLNGMQESEKPSKNLIVIMTDGFENSSTEYNLNKVKSMIRHQEEKYNWTFVYMGMDVTTAKAADELGVKARTYSSKKNIKSNYDIINSAVKTYRHFAVATQDSVQADNTFKEALTAATLANTALYEKELGHKIV